MTNVWELPNFEEIWRDFLNHGHTVNAKPQEIVQEFLVYIESLIKTTLGW